MFSKSFFQLAFITLFVFLSACMQGKTSSSQSDAKSGVQPEEQSKAQPESQATLVKPETAVVELGIHLDVYKSESCSCCNDWVTHIEGAGFTAKTHHPKDLDALKEKLGITNAYSSCHTAMSAGDFVFEGHVPARYIKQFLQEKPEGTYGLSVPAMPVGSPGMEYKDKFMAYPIYLLHKDGQHSVYVQVTSYAQQFE